MAPPKFKPFNPSSQSFTPAPAQGFLQQQYGQYQSGYQSPQSQQSSGYSTPNLDRTTSGNASSTASLSSLANALKDIEVSPVSEDFDAVRGATAMSTIRTAAGSIAEKLQADGPESIERYNIQQHLASLTKVKGSALQREASAFILGVIANKFGPDSFVQPYLLPCLNIPLDLLSDKEGTVKRAAQSALRSLYDLFPAEAKVSVLFSKLLHYLKGSAKWQSKIGALKIVDDIVHDVPSDFLESRFVDAVPVLTSMMHDMKPELSKAGTKSLTDLANRLDNQDIVPRLPIIIKTLNDPKNVPECIKTFSQVTFVAEVTEPALSLLVPILSRALNLTSTTQDALRATVIVVENLTRLVHDPREIRSFIPEMKPGVQKVVDTAALPEVRSLAAKALEVIQSAEHEEHDRKTKISLDETKENLPTVGPVIEEYATQLIQILVNTREFKKLSALYQQLGLTEDEAESTVLHYKSLFNDSRVEDDGEEGIEITNAEFSLAYGGRMLLNKTKLRLFKGHRYGLCGRNGAGKSTLMRSIAEGKLEGFPDKSEVRTCFVEHKLQGSDADLDLVSFIAQDPDLAHVKTDEIASALEEVGFNEERRSQLVGALSGGWKMKLELARAMLMKADILLLDEPTNHLDVGNVKWLEDYLVSHEEITSLIVSHDSGFLDAVCTDIIHYEGKKLVYYKGNLSEFVKVRPEGKSYYTLTDSNVKMAFPPPGILTGVRSNTRAIARMTDVTFSYPGAAKPQMSHVSCSLSLSSRVAILGPNGAGKSTLIKLLTGELVPTSGQVEKHPNLRIGYIAQHALAHVELHKEKTPNQYLQWRYQNGDDREVHMKQSRIVSDEEKAIMEQAIDIGDGYGPRRLESIIGRQKLKKSFQYEIKWIGFLPKFNSMLSREFMIEKGFSKLIQRFDDHEASREGLGYRELSPPVIRKHFEDVGLDGDIADHTPLGSLSGGQLVKVVIAGAMWNNPHLLVLDEPTNYLDRDSLGGLAIAIRDWSGGVVMISHNNEFVGALCPEQWIIENGVMVQKGKAAVDNARFADSNASSAAGSELNSEANSGASTPAATTDADDSPANIKIKKKKKKLTRNEVKAREVRRRLRYLEWLNSPKGTPKPVDTDDEDE